MHVTSRNAKRSASSFCDLQQMQQHTGGLCTAPVSGPWTSCDEGASGTALPGEGKAGQLHVPGCLPSRPQQLLQERQMPPQPVASARIQQQLEQSHQERQSQQQAPQQQSQAQTTMQCQLLSFAQQQQVSSSSLQNDPSNSSSLDKCCTALKLGDGVLLSCRVPEVSPGAVTWSDSGIVLHLKVLQALGFGGNAECYMVELQQQEI